MKTKTLLKDWFLREEPLSWGVEQARQVAEKTDGWITVPKVPCDVHMALERCGRMGDPLVGDNAHHCGWITQRSWWFRKTFSLSEEELGNFGAELFIEILDIHADLFLNGVHIGHHPSAFYPFRRDVSAWLRAGENELLIRLTTGEETVSGEDLAPIRDFVSVDDLTRHTGRGDLRRIMLRKVQSSYGWDQSPKLPTCAIAGDVRLELLDEVVVRDVRFETLELTDAGARILAEAEIENRSRLFARNTTAVFTVEQDGVVVWEKTANYMANTGLNYVDFSFVMPQPQLWWPNGYGAQPLYTVRVKAWNHLGATDEKQITTAVRTVRLEQPATTGEERLYYFVVNGKKIYCKGMDFIHTDCIYARPEDALYDKLLTAAKEANFNMLRFWHGSICYERDYAYELCDRLGILVHQGFAFECAAYPDHLPQFREMVAQEAEYQMRRLRNHPCIAMWCGCGESLGLLISYRGHDVRKELDMAIHPAGTDIFGKILPGIHHRLVATVPYQCTSAFGGYDTAESSQRGDRHPYPFVNLDPDYQQTRISFEVVDEMDARFVTEGGVMSAPAPEALIRYCGGREHIGEDDPIFRHHCNSFERHAVRDAVHRHYTGQRELSLEEYCLLGGLFHGTLLSYEADHYRHLEHCGGTVLWCFTDGFGEVGFSVMDHFGDPKVSYYFMKRAFGQNRVILREEEGVARIYCSNDSGEDKTLELTFGYVDFAGNYGPVGEQQLRLPAFTQSAPVAEAPLTGLDLTRGVFYARVDGGLPVILRHGDFRTLKLEQAAKLTVSNVTLEGETMAFDVTSDGYAHGVHFGLPAERRFSDQYFDLLPGQTYRILLNNAQGVAPEDIIPACVIPG